MFWRKVALWLVAVWLALFVTEFFEDLGMLQYPNPTMDEGIPATLANFGRAIATANDTELARPSAICPWPVLAWALLPSAPLPNPYEPPAILHVKNRPKIYTLHAAFLI
jgi:hypothetical protein